MISALSDPRVALLAMLACAGAGTMGWALQDGLRQVRETDPDFEIGLTPGDAPAPETPAPEPSGEIERVARERVVVDGPPAWLVAGLVGGAMLGVGVAGTLVASQPR
jgi:hypothetical protein